MKSKKIFWIVLLAVIFLLALTTRSNASLYLDNLDFSAQINDDGSMDVTETWDIDISSTNTLYKTFKLDRSKYSEITDVKVKEITNGKNVEFTQTNNWAYHLTKNYYFGGINNEGRFEIAWGVGLDNSSDTRKYEVRYKVIDAMAKYSDCAELYWQFIGSDFEISASKITGTVKLPAKASSKDDIKVWGHVETLNGEIYATSEDTVEFTLNNYRSKNYVEVRIAIPTEIIKATERTYSSNKLNSIIAEETKWADESNIQRIVQKAIKIIAIATIGLVTILLIKQLIKYIEKLKSTKKIKSTVGYEYFREIPNKNSNPADALFLLCYGTLPDNMFGEVFSAILLNLSLKKFFNIKVEEDEKGEEQVVIRKTDKSIEELSYQENKIANFIKDAMGEENQTTIKQLQKYIKRNSKKTIEIIKHIRITTESKNTVEGNYNKKNAKQIKRNIMTSSMYFCCAFYGIIGLIALISKEEFKTLMVGIGLILSILMINAILGILINSKLSNLTQKGIDEGEKWKGLEKYMEDFSLLNEKEVPAIEVWDEYLVYATVFGIADKVIEQLKIVYPQIEQMDNFNTHSYVYLMSHTNFNSSFSSAINSSISSTMSSGSGRRRRILWWRRRRPEAGGRRRRKIKNQWGHRNLVNNE